MLLKAEDYRKTEQNGVQYEGTTYTLGDYYEIEKYVRTYEDGTGVETIYVNHKDWKVARENYIPEIYYKNDFFGERKPRFEIQTTSYGAMDTEEIQKVIKGYQEAIEAVEILTKAFC